MGRHKGSKTGVVQLFDVTCETCQKIFKVEPYYFGHARFCSKACKNIGHSKWMTKPVTEIVVKKCPVCQKPFVTEKIYERLYCTQLCSSKEHGKKVTKPPSVCKTCGKVFKKYGYTAETKPFCSKTCVDESFKRYGEFTCKVCKKVVKTGAYTAKHQITCSTACRTEWIGVNNTYIERIIQTLLEENKIKFIPQYQVGKYVIDFAIPQLKLAIECDGEYWHSIPEQIIHDQNRDRQLTFWKWKTLRLPENLINSNLQECLRLILKALSERTLNRPWSPDLMPFLEVLVSKIRPR